MNRLSRKAYAKRLLIIYGILFIFFCVDKYFLQYFLQLEKIEHYEMAALFYMVIVMMVGVYSMYFFIIIAMLVSIPFVIKRLHDTDVSGWWTILTLIPVLGTFIAFALIVPASTIGTNRFGDASK